MKLLSIGLVVVVWAGCDNSVCVDDVCANPDQTRTFGGPCASRIHVHDKYGRDNVTTGTFEYDPVGNLTRVVTAFDGWGGVMHNTRMHTVDETRWSYDATGAVSSIDGPTTHWTFDPQHVTAVENVTDVTDVYDRTSFAFLPMPGREHRMSPSAALGLISRNSSSGIERYTWTRAEQTLTRTSVDSGNNDTTTTVLQLDERGRIVSWKFTDPSGFTDGGQYIFDGERLVDEISQLDDVRYTYDRGGNLMHVDHRDDPSSREVFDYACWN